MSEQSPAPARGSGHRTAAIALALVSTIVAIGIYNAFSPSQTRLRDCISMGGGANNQCNLPGFATGAIVLVLLLGWGAAARAWRGE